MHVVGHKMFKNSPIFKEHPDKMIEYMGCWAIAPRQIPVGWPQCIEIIKFDLPAPPKLHGFSYEKNMLTRKGQNLNR